MGKGEARTSLTRMWSGLSCGWGLLRHQLTTAQPLRSSTAGALSPFSGQTLGTAFDAAEGPLEQHQGGWGVL